ncbi:unnamed protein product, partial [Sphenostylis stenocarpa]
MRLHEWLGQVARLGCGEVVEIIFQLPPRLLITTGAALLRHAQIRRPPVRAVQDARGTHVQQDDRVPRSEVVLHGPPHRVSALVAQIHRDRDSPLRTG